MPVGLIGLFEVLSFGGKELLGRRIRWRVVRYLVAV